MPHHIPELEEMAEASRRVETPLGEAKIRDGRQTLLEKIKRMFGLGGKE
jgi:hypothetical protein